MRITDDTRRAIAEKLGEVRTGLRFAASILENPDRRSPESLEDALNEIEDAAYQARSVFGAARTVGKITRTHDERSAA